MVHDEDGCRSQYKAQSVIMGLSFNIGESHFRTKTASPEGLKGIYLCEEWIHIPCFINAQSQKEKGFRTALIGQL